MMRLEQQKGSICIKNVGTAEEAEKTLKGGHEFGCSMAASLKSVAVLRKAQCGCGT